MYETALALLLLVFMQLAALVLPSPSCSETVPFGCGGGRGKVCYIFKNGIFFTYVSPEQWDSCPVEHWFIMRPDILIRAALWRMSLTLLSIIYDSYLERPPAPPGIRAIPEAALERQGWAHFFLLQLCHCTSIPIYAPAVWALCRAGAESAEGSNHM